MISLQFLTMIGSKIYWVYWDYSLLEAPWSTLLAMLDLLIYILSWTLPVQATSPAQTLELCLLSVDFGTVSSQLDLASSGYNPSADFGNVSSQLDLAVSGYVSRQTVKFFSVFLFPSDESSSCGLQKSSLI